MQFKGVAVDSREVLPGQLFFALPGAKTDGHDYLQDVSKKGAAGAVVSSSYKGDSFGLKLYFVNDVLHELQKMACEQLKRTGAKIIAVTGSMGKTTTKDFIATLLSETKAVAKTNGNNNSKVGLPLSILNTPDQNYDYYVVEMGMTHTGNIFDLVQLAPPEIAAITCANLVHACNFDNVDQIALAKSEILSHPDTKLAIVHQEIDNFDEITQKRSCRIESFSISSGKGDWQLEGQDLKVKYKGQTVDLGKLNVLGDHNRNNALVAIAVAHHCGLSWDEIRSGLKKLKLPERRLEVVELKGIVFVNDSYNANEISVKGALKSLPPTKGKKFAVLGEVAELGPFSQSCHEQIGKFALGSVDRLLCFGNEMKYAVDIWKEENRPAELYSSLDELAEVLKKEVQAGDVVLLKGSRSKKMWEVLGAFK